VVPTDQPGIIRFVWTNLERDPIAAKYWQNIASVRLRARTTLPSLQGFIAVTALNDNPSFGASPTQYRPVVKWSTDKFTTGICTVSPVPFDQSFQLSFHADQEGSAWLRILSPTGRLIREERKLLPSGDQSWSVHDASTWPAGVYMYQLVQGNMHHAGCIVKR